MHQEHSEDEISDISADSVHIEEELALLESQLDREAVEAVENGLYDCSDKVLEKFSGSSTLCGDTQGAFTCNTCMKTCFNMQDLARHIETHNRWRFKCNQCGKYFKSKAVLNTHQQRHLPHKSFRCYICDKPFITNNDLQNHVKVHKEQHMRHRCEICGKDFGRIYTLRSHMKLHDPEPEFNCGRCGKIFPKRRNLLLHERTHLIEDSLSKGK